MKDCQLVCVTCGSVSVYALKEPLPTSVPCLAPGDCSDCLYVFSEQEIADVYQNQIDNS